MSDTTFGVVVTVAVMLMVGILACAITGSAINVAWQKEAVEEGHAEFYLDVEHMRQWRWLPAPEKGEPDEQGTG